MLFHLQGGLGISRGFLKENRMGTKAPYSGWLRVNSVTEKALLQYAILDKITWKSEKDTSRSVTLSFFRLPQL